MRTRNVEQFIKDTPSSKAVRLDSRTGKYVQ